MAISRGVSALLIAIVVVAVVAILVVLAKNVYRNVYRNCIKGKVIVIDTRDDDTQPPPSPNRIFSRTTSQDRLPPPYKPSPTAPPAGPYGQESFQRSLEESLA